MPTTTSASNGYLEDKKIIARNFADKKVLELIKNGEIKQQKMKSDRELGISTVSGGRYIRAFTKLPNLDIYEKSVLLNLASRLDFRGLDENGFFQDEVRYITQEQLADDLSISERKIRDVITSLINKNFIEKKNHYNFEKKRRSVNSYSITENAFIECFNTLKNKNEEKYKEYLEELERAKQHYANMFLTSSRVQAIHDQPAQHAGWNYIGFKKQPAQYAGWSGTYMPVAPAQCADIVLLYLPQSFSCSLMCVNNITWDTHIEIRKPTEQKIEGILKLALIENSGKKKTWKTTQKNGNEITMNMQWKLSNVLRSMFKIKFVDNEDCKYIINKVVTSTNCTLKDFSNLSNEILNYDFDVIFSQNKFNVDSISQDLIKWITSKQEILAKIGRDYNCRIELNEKMQTVLEEGKEKEEKVAKDNLMKLEKEKIEFEELPKDFKEWFSLLSVSAKKGIKEQIRKYGIKTFSNNIIPTIYAFQNRYKHKVSNKFSDSIRQVQ